MGRKRRISESALQVAALALRESFPDLTPGALRDALERTTEPRSVTKPAWADAPDRLCPPREAEKILSVTRRTLFTWAKQGRLHPVTLVPGHRRSIDDRRIGGRIGFRLSALKRIVNRRERGNNAFGDNP